MEKLTWVNKKIFFKSIDNIYLFSYNNDKRYQIDSD